MLKGFKDLFKTKSAFGKNLNQSSIMNNED